MHACFQTNGVMAALWSRSHTLRPCCIHPSAPLPPPPASLCVVPAGLPELIRQERQQRLATAQAQVAYDAEVAALKLGKLQAYFESTLAEHVVAVHPFAEGAEAAAGGRGRSARTIRPPELPREVQVCHCFGCVS